MRPLVIEDPAPLYAALKPEAAETADPVFLHRVHCLILLAKGLNCNQVGTWFSHSPRTIQRWVHHYRQFGVEGLRNDKKPGRLASLDMETVGRLQKELTRPPCELGVPSREWNSRVLALHIKSRYGVSLSQRQCLRWLKRLSPPMHVRQQ